MQNHPQSFTLFCGYSSDVIIKEEPQEVHVNIDVNKENDQNIKQEDFKITKVELEDDDFVLNDEDNDDNDNDEEEEDDDYKPDISLKKPTPRFVKS